MLVYNNQSSKVKKYLKASNAAMSKFTGLKISVELDYNSYKNT